MVHVYKSNPFVLYLSSTDAQMVSSRLVHFLNLLGILIPAVVTKPTEAKGAIWKDRTKRDAGGVPRDESRKPSFLDDQNRKTKDEHDEVTAKKFSIDVGPSSSTVATIKLIDVNIMKLTSLLLSNLLDVVEEAYLIHVELDKVIKTSFHSPRVDQLDLQLQFIDFKTGCKVTLTLDMTSLK
ncbi:hypothetical protein MKW98_031695, partial [Papaver atlanticum]